MAFVFADLVLIKQATQAQKKGAKEQFAVGLCFTGPQEPQVTKGQGNSDAAAQEGSELKTARLLGTHEIVRSHRDIAPVIPGESGVGLSRLARSPSASPH